MRSVEVSVAEEMGRLCGHRDAADLVTDAFAEGWAGVVPARRFFHGTDAVLVAGDVLVPGVVSGRRNHECSDSSQVYVTSMPAVAGGYLQRLHGGAGFVYEVAAPDACNATPREWFAAEWTAPSATVLRVVSPAEVAEIEAALLAAEQSVLSGGHGRLVWVPYLPWEQLEAHD